MTFAFEDLNQEFEADVWCEMCEEEYARQDSKLCESCQHDLDQQNEMELLAP